MLFRTIVQPACPGRPKIPDPGEICGLVLRFAVGPVQGRGERGHVGLVVQVEYPALALALDFVDADHVVQGHDHPAYAFELRFEAFLLGVDHHAAGFAEQQPGDFEKAVQLALADGFRVEFVDFSFAEETDAEDEHRRRAWLVCPSC